MDATVEEKADALEGTTDQSIARNVLRIANAVAGVLVTVFFLIPATVLAVAFYYGAYLAIRHDLLHLGFPFGPGTLGQFLQTLAR